MSMVITDLVVPTADVSWRDLGVCVNGPTRPVLSSRTLVDAPSTSLSMGIIGASHVIEVRDAHNPLVREEVSCLAATAAGEALPVKDGRADYRQRFPSADYHFSLRTSIFSDDEFADKAATVMAQLDASWLVARFPGEGDYHITALGGAWVFDRWCWTTYHLYPQEGAIVRTQSAWIVRN